MKTIPHHDNNDNEEQTTYDNNFDNTDSDENVENYNDDYEVNGDKTMPPPIYHDFTVNIFYFICGYAQVVIRSC